ncbi:outer membrane protein OmpA-like peptidoglycan-associated protein [Wenyingzhuangia heitensis]|uniref:Outer membrane protein OmpA-like peptidoglycan-associated protein n=1 Tax=Wenyingzhuangia heitensis TaxID=1487859 RepID=A0ABX0U7T6_9FLAO|nr:OmpA family protein [Wenyingzhuangia heitensis]NIJ43686.1 outer membrane protein OmpA-like peptidoglycan-associated protein [Wenyingzhuangia heitensis]
MKILFTFLAISISSLTYAQDCCNVIDSESTNIVTSNGNCVVTKAANGDCDQTPLLVVAMVEPKLKPYEINILNKALRGVKFKTNSDELLPKSYTKLHDVSTLLKTHEDFMLTINGYTDNTGSSEYNHKLSHERAEAAKQHLVKVDGIDADRITTNGYGEENPIATNNTEKGKAKNRRVEFKVFLKK